MQRRNIAREKIIRYANKVLHDIKKSIKPTFETPVRALSNVEFNPDTGIFELKTSIKRRKLTAHSSKAFAQTLRMMSFAKSLIDENSFSTLREAYYISKNWAEARFTEQQQSNEVIEDLEASLGVIREDLGFFPEQDGSSVVGNLEIVDRSGESPLKIDCTKLGTGAYNVPNAVEELEFNTGAEFVLAIETAGMFVRLNREKFWKKMNCILVSLKGVPARATRRFIKRLHDEEKLPVYVFTDGDPYGYANIYRTLKVGSGKAIHVAKEFAVPDAMFLGVTPTDITEYDLPTHPLAETDIKRIKDILANDPFFKAHKKWIKELSKMMSMKKRAEQQALAKYGLKYVADVYLPQKLEDKSTWLP